jgi:predicted nuclease of predicted toxin-antitoxin system
VQPAVRLYLDHDVDVALAERLRQGGHDVLTTREVGHADSLDEQQLAFATREERAFVTHNRRDFRRLHREWTARGRLHGGIIISAHLPLEELERRLRRLFSAYPDIDLRGQLIPLHAFR